MAAPTPTPPYPPVPEEPSRPLGVAILAVLIGIVGFVVLIIGILLLAVGGAGAFTHAFSLEVLGFGGGIVLTIFGLILLGVALGLWHQRMWALVLSILVVGLLLVSEFISRGIAALATISGIVLLILLIYLIAVHRHFA